MFITLIESKLGQFANDTNNFISEKVALHFLKKQHGWGETSEASPLAEVLPVDG